MYSDGSSKEALYRYTKVNDYEYPVHIFALDYYRPGSQGEDDFSRKEAWFYYLGGEDLEREFSERMSLLLEDLFVDNSVDWDYLTLAPSNEKDGLNSNMLSLCEKLSERAGIEYRQVLRRTRKVNETGEMGSVERMIIEQKGSIEVTGDVKDANVVIIDNVSISGFFLSYITEMLLKAGAKRVCCVCLGVTNSIRDVERLDKGITASGAMVDLKGDGDE